MRETYLAGLADGSQAKAEQLSAAEPVCFAQTVGLFTSPSGNVPAVDVAVLFASPWGLEDLSARKFFRIIADELAAIGIASLRFDYPGTGDSIDPISYEGGLSLYHDCLMSASRYLRHRSGCKRLVIIGQGLGSVLALRATDIHPDGIAFIAPFTSGRAYLRELSIWAKVVDESLGLPATQSADTAIAGFTMPASISDDIAKIKLGDIKGNIPRSVFLAERPDHIADAKFAETLMSSGAVVKSIPFPGYNSYISNPTKSLIPKEIVHGLIAWVPTVQYSDEDIAITASSPVASSDENQGQAFRERPVRFGKNERLYGVVCEPLEKPPVATAILISSGYDRHAGWGRLSVKIARRLAEAGIRSLRYDGANVADSPPLAGGPEQVLYTETQLQDAQDALDFVTRLGETAILAYGRCSGGYVAYQSAIADKRWSAIVAVNPPFFRWDGSVDLDQALRAVPKPLTRYIDLAFRRQTYRRLLSGNLDLKQSIKNILFVLSKKISIYLPLRFSQDRKKSQITQDFASLDARNAPLHLVYSAEDVGYLEFLSQFRQMHSFKKKYKNFNVTVIEETDHNFSPITSQEELIEIIKNTALALK